MKETRDHHGNLLKVGDIVRPTQSFQWWIDNNVKGRDSRGIIEAITESTMSGANNQIIVNHFRVDGVTYWGGVRSNPGIELVIDEEPDTRPKGAREIDERFARRAAAKADKLYTKDDLDRARNEGYDKGHEHGEMLGYSQGYADNTTTCPCYDY